MENENSMRRLQGKMPKKMDGCKFTKGDAIYYGLLDGYPLARYPLRVNHQCV